MKKIVLLIGLSIFLYSGAFAQFSGQLSTPQTMANGYSWVGGYVGIYDGALGILGQYRYGVGGYTDIGFKLGVIDFNSGFHHSNTGFNVAFDFKYLAMERHLRDPINLSVGGGIEFPGVEDFTIISFAGNVVGSYPVNLRNGRILEPYGRLQLRIQNEHVHHYGSNTDFEIGFNPGVSFELSKTVRAIGEIQFDESTAFFMGLDFDI